MPSAVHGVVLRRVGPLGGPAHGRHGVGSIGAAGAHARHLSSPHGIEYFLAFYDVHSDYFNGVFRSRRGLEEVSDVFRRLRQCYPHRQLFVILDNLHLVHDHPRFLSLLEKLHIHPVWTPTQASWLNLIEAQFGALKKFTVANTDDASHQRRQDRVRAYLNYRHRRLGNLSHPLRRMSHSR